MTQYNRRSIIAIVIAAVCVIAGGFAIAKGIMTALDYSKGKSVYEEITEDTVFRGVKSITDGKESSGLTVDFDALYTKNSDIKGWIYIPDTNINYPVVWCENNTKYLKTAFTGERLSSGTIFIDSKYNDGDENIVMYGHHMKDGSMLTDLEKYKEQSFFDEHSVGYYITPDAEYIIEFICAKLTKGIDDAFITSYTDENIYHKYLSELTNNSVAHRNVELTQYSKIITLVTCDYSQNDGRLAVIGKLTEIKEKR